LRDSTASDRLRAEIRVTLPADAAHFVLRPRLTNPTSQPVALQFWVNAALTLGSASTSPNTEFFLPAQTVIVHSTGDSALPGERQTMPWPIADSRDLSWYRNWRNWLGVFVPDINRDVAGAYNHDAGLGVVRIFPPDVARGLKLFAFGSGFPARGEYADDGSEYFELWAGPCRTFWPEDEVSIGAGQSLEWSEVWLPFSAIGGMDAATARAVAKTAVQDGQARIGIAVSEAMSGRVAIQWNGQAWHEDLVQLDPATPFVLQLPLPAGATLPGQLSLQVQDSAGATWLAYSREVQ